MTGLRHSVFTLAVLLALALIGCRIKTPVEQATPENSRFELIGGVHLWDGPAIHFTLVVGTPKNDGSSNPENRYPAVLLAENEVQQQHARVGSDNRVVRVWSNDKIVLEFEDSEGRVHWVDVASRTSTVLEQDWPINIISNEKARKEWFDYITRRHGAVIRKAAR